MTEDLRKLVSQCNQMAQGEEPPIEGSENEDGGEKPSSEDIEMNSGWSFPGESFEPLA